MNKLLLATGTAVLVVGCADGRDVLGPSTPGFEQQGRALNDEAPAARQAETSGDFAALVDFETLTLTPRGQNCLLTVDGRLVFSGTIAGTATGTTSALVFATCPKVATTPPGTFPDVFRSELEFEGTVDGEPATAKLLYMGSVQVGGAIDGRLIFSRGVSGMLDAQALVAVGGTYSGKLVVH